MEENNVLYNNFVRDFGNRICTITAGPNASPIIL